MDDEVTKVDQWLPDYDGECIQCGESPTVDGWRNGKLVYHGRMCGPFTWGTAEAVNPATWND